MLKKLAGNAVRKLFELEAPNFATFLKILVVFKNKF